MAAGSRRTGTVEIGVGHGFAWLAEVDADTGLLERVRAAKVPADVLQDVVTLALERHFVDAQHALGGVVVGCKARFPVGEVAPLRILEIRTWCAIKRRRIREAPAAHRRSAENENVLECCQPPDTLQAKLRRPEHASQLPCAARQALIAETAAAFEHRHAVSLFRQA